MRGRDITPRRSGGTGRRSRPIFRGAIGRRRSCAGEGRAEDDAVPCRHRHDARIVRHTEVAVGKIRVPARVEPVPAHVRFHHVIGQFLNSPAHNSEAIDVAFLGKVEEQLHSEAQSQERLAEVSQGVNKSSHAQIVHGGWGRAGAGEDQAVAGGDFLAGLDSLSMNVEAVERPGDACAIAGVVVKKADHRTPFVDGMPRSWGQPRKAWRRHRPSPLKSASILWCSFFPRRIVMCRPQRSDWANDSKKWGTSSVGSSPTYSRRKLPVKTKQGRPDRSIATSASDSSMGSRNP